MNNPTKQTSTPMLKVKTHLKAGQAPAVCPDPNKAYSDGYNAGYNDSRNKGPKNASHYNSGGGDWWW